MVSPYGAALALLDDLAEAGARVVVDADGDVATDGDVPDALGARLAGLLGEGEHRVALTAHGALRAVLAAPCRAARELLALPIAYAKLPIAYAFTFARKQAGGVEALGMVTTSGAIYKRERGRVPLFVLREVEAAARAFRQGRAGGVHLDAWLAAKARGDWLLTPEHANVLPGDFDEPDGLTFGELLEGLGAELTAFEWGAA